ncbi:MAG: hypothetical protein O9264_02870 [Leptospira sp.]|nr:hypothetical protein [Leptospira sp.]
MSTLIETLKKANIPLEIAYEIESEMEKKFVAKGPFPPLKWEKEVLMPIQQEQFKTSERLENLRVTMDARFEALETKMDSKFEALESKMDAKFEALESKMDARFLAFKSEMDSKFEAVSIRFQSIEDRFRIFTWMQGVLMVMIFAIFSKLYFGM